MRYVQVLRFAVVFLLACQGASGPQGPAGSGGAGGPAGTQGAVGPDGAKGDPGGVGQNGVNGLNGSNADPAVVAALLQASPGFRADLAEALGTDVLLLNRLATGTASRLASDATFEAGVIGGAADLLAVDSAFQAAVAGKSALLDGVKTALTTDSAFRNAVALTVSDQTDLNIGECMTLTHNFGRYGVQYQALMTESGSWIPMVYMAMSGLTNLALNKNVVCSSTYNSSYLCSNGNNGIIVSGDRWLPATGANQGDWQVDLGSVQLVSKVRVYSGWSDTANYWQIFVSNDGVNFPTLVATGSCTLGASCNSYIDSDFDPVPARWVRIHTVTGGASYHGVGEVEVFGATYPIQFPNANQIKLCNYTGTRRSFTLVASR